MAPPPELDVLVAEPFAESSEGSAQKPMPHLNTKLPIPRYLQETYWWAYLHPRGVKFFDRLWMVNAILFGNFNGLRDAALVRLGDRISGKLIQIAAVYGDITPKIAARMEKGAEYHLVDVAPIQLNNVARKLETGSPVRLVQQDSTAMTYATATFDTVLLFFLLHEQPDEIKRKTCAEAMRVLKPGGRLILVDYHQPKRWNPWRYWFVPFLAWLEPFALALWGRELTHWFPDQNAVKMVHKETKFGGLYQVVELQDLRSES